MVIPYLAIILLRLCPKLQSLLRDDEAPSPTPLLLSPPCGRMSQKVGSQVSGDLGSSATCFLNFSEYGEGDFKNSKTYKNPGNVPTQKVTIGDTVHYVNPGADVASSIAQNDQVKTSPTKATAKLILSQDVQV